MPVKPFPPPHRLPSLRADGSAEPNRASFLTFC